MGSSHPTIIGIHSYWFGYRRRSYCTRQVLPHPKEVLGLHPQLERHRSRLCRPTSVLLNRHVSLDIWSLYNASADGVPQGCRLDRQLFLAQE